MKLWKEKSGSSQLQAKQVEEFTVGTDLKWDLLLAKHDVHASKAHAKMLGKVGLIPVVEAQLLVDELDQIAALIQSGLFRLEEGVEDVHSQIEHLLTEKLGDVGKKIHLGRSRNDQVLTAIKLFIKEELGLVQDEMQSLKEILNLKSATFQSYSLPGYTHFQVAMPSSVSLWLGAYAESLEEDVEFINAAIKVADKNPLGSAAGYGSNLPLDREFTTKEIGFSGMNENVVYAQMTRGKTEKVAAMALSVLAGTLNKLSYDAILFMSQDMGFISFPNHLTTGSSIMPHKKNPDVWEIIRSKTNQLQALPNTITLMTTNLPSGYHRDLQLLKEELFPAFQKVRDCLKMSGLMISNLQVRENILEDEKYKYITSVDEVNKLVMEGMPFRDAYRVVAERIASGTF